MPFTIVLWNVRGLGKKDKVTAVCSSISTSKARVVFIQESKMEMENKSVVKRLMGKNFHERVIVPSEVASSGLISLWDADFFSMESKQVSRRLIVLEGKLIHSNLKVGLINVYALNDHAERREFLLNLNELRLPVIIGGDFNTVRSDDEKLGGLVNVEASKVFSDFVLGRNLIDLPLEGSAYT
ncbi:uncharacterized protein LOC120178352 [Hibiscus syriacus]|uniref:uncharacterized protein LOC120178352 n=1 Tax=Hibiscus syriacus TaxID=106335 RepID=UPI001920A37C|nr:uncharacterized protein LOC120178352 [Hibiscus syriacus]